MNDSGIETAERPQVELGARVDGTDNTRIGVVDAVFVDYLLVRTAGLPPVDLYVPTADIQIDDPRRIRVEASRGEAYERWHRPLKSVAHD
ncbi:MAG TPA: hypothetical protein VFN14_04585 [Candidatus Limnocylindria bacterium]|nr:hypothetical protein [Candidatus Limnocylindria bacterium]